MAKGFHGGFPGGGNMNQLMKQAQMMQKKLEKAQEEAAALTAEATAGGGMVKASVSSDHQLTALEIKPEVVDPEDVDMLVDLVTAAVNEAMANLDKAVEERMGAVTGGMGGFGGLGGLGF